VTRTCTAPLADIPGDRGTAPGMATMLRGVPAPPAAAGNQRPASPADQAALYLYGITVAGAAAGIAGGVAGAAVETIVEAAWRPW